jgi:ABC-type transporter Mla MlaB component
MRAGRPRRRAACRLRMECGMAITSERRAAGAVLEIGGELRREDLPAIREQVAAAQRSGERVRIDLSAVESLDREAILFFAIGEGRAIEIVGCPRHVQQWMRCEARQYRATGRALVARGASKGA